MPRGKIVLVDETLATDCPKCGFHQLSPTPVCAKCGVVFARFSPEKKHTYASQVLVSTTTLAEAYETVGPVYAITTNLRGVLDAAAKKLGIDIRAVTDTEFLSAFATGDSVANYQAFPVAFAVCVEQLKRDAASLGANAVIGMRMNFDLDRSGGGLSAFTMQLFGTAVRRHHSPEVAPTPSSR
jgi:uncharacterized protein YbjQ (UPF0145 family)